LLRKAIKAALQACLPYRFALIVASLPVIVSVLSQPDRFLLAIALFSASQNR
jgi:hypothetical protein